MEIRLVLIPLLGALTLALGIAVAEPNSDARPADSHVSETSTVEETEIRKPVVWEQDIPDLDLDTESPAELSAEKQSEKTASTPKPASEI